jgi:tyrosine aminotransferase
MIKASKFSLSVEMPLMTSVMSFKHPENHEKSFLNFTYGDVTKYGHKDIKMTEEGYNIVR